MRRSLAIAALALSVLLAAQGSASAAEVYLVAAGNNVGTAGEQALSFAERDATGFARLMKRLGGVKSHNSAVVLGEKASGLRRTILETNARLRAAEQSHPDSSVLIVYYSGHADANGLHMEGDTLAYDELRALISGSPATVRLLIIDGCRSGALTRVKGIEQPPGATFRIQVEDRLAVEGVAIITSSAAGEDSHESDRLRGSYFTHHLVAGLRGAADKNRDKRITLDEAYAYAYRQTLRSSGAAEHLQHPTYDYDIRGRGGLVLTSLAADRGRSGQLILGSPGLYLLFEGDDTGPVISEVVVGPDGAQIVVPPGQYLVQRREARAYHEFRLALQAGQSMTLDDQPHETLAYARLLRKGEGVPRAIVGLQLLGGARGEILPGVGVTPQLTLGCTVDLEWLSIGARVRWSTGSSLTEDRGTALTHHEAAFGITLERYLDLRWFSLSFGAAIEGVLHFQSFETSGVAPPRTGWGVAITVLIAIERELGGGLSLRIEGGPRTEIFERVSTSGGASTGARELESPFTWWVGGGLVWRL